jgi:hypothetical protein
MNTKVPRNKCNIQSKYNKNLFKDNEALNGIVDLLMAKHLQLYFEKYEDLYLQNSDGTDVTYRANAIERTLNLPFYQILPWNFNDIIRKQFAMIHLIKTDQENGNFIEKTRLTRIGDTVSNDLIESFFYDYFSMDFTKDISLEIVDFMPVNMYDFEIFFQRQFSDVIFNMRAIVLRENKSDHIPLLYFPSSVALQLFGAAYNILFEIMDNMLQQMKFQQINANDITEFCKQLSYCLNKLDKVLEFHYKNPFRKWHFTKYILEKNLKN